MNATASDESTRSRRRWSSARTSIALLVLGALLLPLCVATVWTRNQVLDTQRYLDTVEPLADDPAVRALVAERISMIVIEGVDLEGRSAELLGELSPRAEALAPLIAAGGQVAVRNVTEEFLASDQFRRLWRAANERAHTQMVAVLTGREGTAIEASDGVVTLQLAPVARAVAEQLDERLGIEVPERVLDGLDAEVVLFQSEDLAAAQSAVRLLDRLAWAVVITGITLLTLGVALAPDRRRGVQRLGIAIATSMVVTLLAIGFARGRYIAALPQSALVRESGTASFDALLRLLVFGFRAVLLGGVVVLGVAWLLGPSALATRARGVFHRPTAPTPPLT